MRLNILALIASVALVAACETAPEESAASSGAGASKPLVHNWGTYSNTPVATEKAGPAAGSQEDLVANVGDRVFFDFDKYNLAPEARATLAKQAAWLKRYSSVTVRVEGHCDERGTREYNLALGERRANSVKDYLITLGIGAGRITTISYGKERPVALGSNEQAWSQNRRGVTTVTGGSPSS
ncbi:MAG: peptidoglycan-associated lipoprotein Pal [Rhodospirillales bacterium]|nr:peptidoglycan-associated lipoprotein Pal [Rhodospirillales bacterium]MDP6883828.1 peptidoglycan-associated lipoprotein Pal [Rhodospirillales bacterium]